MDLLMRRLVAIVCLVLCAWGVQAQKVGDEASVKAAFIYNFAKYTEWGALPAGAPVVVCVVGDNKLLTAVTEAVKGQQASGRAFDVTRPADGSTWGSCQVLFIAAPDVGRSSVALDRLRQRPVLTVSDGNAFARTGGIIEFFREGDRMRFAINVAASERAGVRISSRVLALAKIIKSYDAQ
jgi:hypothetical protein